MSNVPKLRFKEFSGEWSKNKISIKIISGNTYPLEAYSREKGTLLVQGLNIYPNELVLDKPIYISSEYLTGKDVLVKNEDILVGLNRPIIGKKLKACLFMEDSAVLYQRAGILDFDKSKLHNRFLFQYLFSQSFIKQLLAELVGSDQPYIKSDLFKVTKNIFPSKLEQEKIAFFLTSVDTKIEQLTKKETLLQEYKKGVMNKIFNQEIRFKDDDGSEFPEWEEKRLEDLAQIIGGGTPETSKEEYWNGDIQWFTPTEIKFDYVSESIRTISELGLKKSSAKILPIGTILLTTRATIGEVSIALRECTTNQGFQSLVVKSNHSNIFIFNWIKNNKYKFISKANGSTFPEISKSEIEKIKITIPSLKEQTKIANFLSSIDKKIELTIKELNSTKEFKKALLQQMFV